MYYGKEKFSPNSSLKHWKYIKKVRVNGKWKYYYDADQLKKDLGVTAKKEADKAHDKAMVEDAISTEAMKEAIQKRNQASSNLLYARSGVNTSKTAAQYRKDIADAEISLYNANKAAERAKKDYYEKQAAYHKTPLGKLNKFVNKAKTKVEKILGKDIWKDNEDFRVTRG